MLRNRFLFIQLMTTKSISSPFIDNVTMLFKTKKQKKIQKGVEIQSKGLPITNLFSFPLIFLFFLSFLIVFFFISFFFLLELTSVFSAGQTNGQMVGSQFSCAPSSVHTRREKSRRIHLSSREESWSLTNCGCGPTVSRDGFILRWEEVSFPS